MERLAAARELLRASGRGAAGAVDGERRREEGIAAALAAFDGGAAPARLRPRPARAAPRRTWQVVGIAAAAALLALAVPLLASVGDGADGADDEASDVALDAPTEERTADESVERASPMAGDDAVSESGASSEAGLPRLGSFDDVSALTAALVEQRSAPTAATPYVDQDRAAALAGTPCAAVGPDADQRWLADLAGQEVVVLVSDQPDGSAGVLVVDALGCAVVGRTGIPASPGG